MSGRFTVAVEDDDNRVTLKICGDSPIDTTEKVLRQYYPNPDNAIKMIRERSIEPQKTLYQLQHYDEYLYVVAKLNCDHNYIFRKNWEWYECLRGSFLEE